MFSKMTLRHSNETRGSYTASARSVSDKYFEADWCFKMYCSSSSKKAQRQDMKMNWKTSQSHWLSAQTQVHSSTVARSDLIGSVAATTWGTDKWQQVKDLVVEEGNLFAKGLVIMNAGLMRVCRQQWTMVKVPGKFGALFLQMELEIW